MKCTYILFVKFCLLFCLLFNLWEDNQEVDRKNVSTISLLDYRTVWTRTIYTGLSEHWGWSD